MLEGAFHEYKEKQGGCPDCGNSPVNHFESYCSHTLSILASREGGWFARVHSYVSALADKTEPLFYRTLAALPFARFAHDPTAAVTYRSQVVWEEALRRGIAMEQLVIFGIHTEIYRAKLPEGWRYFQSLPIRQRGESSEWLDDKYRLKSVLRANGIHSPRAMSVTSGKAALDALHTFGAPVVVKPREGSRGRHTTVNVRTDEELRDAFRIAQKLCRYVVVEEYLEGSVCRGTVVGGKLAGFFQAQPPRIIGDGISTVRELIVRANREKPARVQDIEMSDEHRRFIGRLGFTLDSVLPEGRVLTLTHRTGRLFGGRTRELLGREHPALRAELERAAAILDTAIVGFDLVIADPERDPSTQRWGIIEANSVPYIDLHYLPLEGTPSVVAKDVWDFVLASPTRS